MPGAASKAFFFQSGPGRRLGRVTLSDLLVASLALTDQLTSTAQLSDSPAGSVDITFEGSD